MKKLKETIKNIMKEESEYQTFFKKALEKSGKSITQMSDEEKKAFFNKIDAAWDGKGEKNEELVGNQHKLDIDGDGEIEASDLAALRAGKKKDESINELKWQDAEVGDSANVTAINKTGVIVKVYGRKFHLKFADGNMKTYDANELTFVKNESVNENTLKPGTKLRYEKNSFVIDYIVDKEYKGRDGFTRYILKVVKSNYPKKIKIGSAEEYEDSRLTGLIRSGVIKFVKNESVNLPINENFSSSDVEKIKSAVEGASSFMGIGKELKSMGIKYDFSTSPLPVYMIKKGAKTFVLVNKKYAEDPQFVVGDTAGGLLEGKVNESIEYSKDGYVKKMLNAAGKLVKDITLNGVQYRYNPVYKTYNSVKGNELLHKSHIMGESKLKESEFKGGDKVIISHPTMGKPLKGVVSTVIDAKGEKVLVLKGNQGVWDAKFAKLDEGKVIKHSDIKWEKNPKGEFEPNVQSGDVVNVSGKKYKVQSIWASGDITLVDDSKNYKTIRKESVNEGNAFGAAVTKAKKEGLKEFEFNGKKYKVKKGSYEKNESAKKLAEKAKPVTKK